ncbi:MAG: alpha/beta hydrolase [Acidobacteriota bacterium]|nr:alpha/beta hydrolase [Acidobacteriota bacterium]
MPLPAFNPPSKLLLLLEARALFEFGAFYPSQHLLRNLPEGDGHPVLVYPGFMASDFSTRVLRKFLDKLGYEALPWKLGRNLGYSPVLDAQMQEHLSAMHQYFGRKLTLIGWSLGGVYARELARVMPECVRQVITMGSPFAGSTRATNVSWLYDLVTGEKLNDIDPNLLKRLAEQTPVPSTAIYSRTDGIVAWQSCVDPHPDEQHENIEVPGSHFGFGFNPWAMHVIADRLAQPEDNRAPFDYEGWRALFFPHREQRNQKRLHNESRWQNACSTLDEALARLT